MQMSENAVRRLAKRRGCTVRKSRARNPDAIEYGGFMLVDSETNGVILGGSPFAYSADLQDVSDYLTG